MSKLWPMAIVAVAIVVLFILLYSISTDKPLTVNGVTYGFAPKTPAWEFASSREISQPDNQTIDVDEPLGIDNKHGACFLTKVGGAIDSNHKVIAITQKEDTGEYRLSIHSDSPHSGLLGRAACIKFAQPSTH